jgi:hypothetical protein
MEVAVGDPCAEFGRNFERFLTENCNFLTKMKDF